MPRMTCVHRLVTGATCGVSELPRGSGNCLEQDRHRAVVRLKDAPCVHARLLNEPRQISSSSSGNQRSTWPVLLLCSKYGGVCCGDKETRSATWQQPCTTRGNTDMYETSCISSSSMLEGEQKAGSREVLGCYRRRRGGGGGQGRGRRWRADVGNNSVTCSTQPSSGKVPRVSGYRESLTTTDATAGETKRKLLSVSDDDRVPWSTDDTEKSDWKLPRGMTPLLGLGAAIGGLNLQGPESVAEALGVLAAIVAVHECGHFLAARLQNIHVSKFAVGFGPKIISIERDEIEYSLRLFPLGGFVGFPDDDPECEYDKDDPDLLRNRPIRDRAIVVSAGVIANLIFAFSILFVQASTLGLNETKYFPGVVVADVFEQSAAAQGGLLKGDVVLSSAGVALPADESAVRQLVDSIQEGRAGRPFQLQVRRGEEQQGLIQTLNIYPDRNPDGTGRIGVQLARNALFSRKIGGNVIESAALAGRECVRLTGIILDGLREIVFKFSDTVEKVSGPVAIVAVGAEVARTDTGGLLQFAALVNLNLAVVNTLPLPALDGGYLAFLLLETIRGGKKVPEDVEKIIMSSGILLLLTVGIVLTVRDTLNLTFFHDLMMMSIDVM